MVTSIRAVGKVMQRQATRGPADGDLSAIANKKRYKGKDITFKDGSEALVMQHAPWLFDAEVSQAVVSIVEMRDGDKALLWESGIWEDGKWEDGLWNDGIWKGGTWLKGIWYEGTWKRGSWKAGTWQTGIWESGIHYHGIWMSGLWEKGLWRDGTWRDGTWRDGVWVKGRDNEGVIRKEPPNKW